MAVRTKGRRKIVVDGRHYIWRVADSNDPGGRLYWSHELRIIAEDRSLYIVYPLNPCGPSKISDGIYVPAQEEPPFVFFTDKETKRLSEKAYQGIYSLCRCPRFEREDGAITPQSVKDLIQWCSTDSEPRIRVDWKNRLI
ncbi:MAG: hypothetical protein DPW16_04630 [Chloroflexi bacterium]|nr:hypothetical protein [Chloroflexota bacterium]